MGEQGRGKQNCGNLCADLLHGNVNGTDHNLLVADVKIKHQTGQTDTAI